MCTQKRSNPSSSLRLDSDILVSDRLANVLKGACGPDAEFIPILVNGRRFLALLVLTTSMYSISMWDYGPGFEREYTLPSGKRVDGINLDTREVIELKPKNPRAIRDGERQLDRYLEELNRKCPGDTLWTGRVETYDP